MDCQAIEVNANIYSLPYDADKNHLRSFRQQHRDKCEGQNTNTHRTALGGWWYESF